MMYRMFPLAAFVLATFLGTAALAVADEEKTTHTGKVVSIAEDKLVMSDKDDKEHSHALTTEVKMTCDTKDCKFEEIKAGMRIRVTTKTDTKKTVTKIEALDKNAEFEKVNN